MRAIDWLKGSKCATAAENIASLISRDIPPGVELSRLDLSANRVTTILQRAYTKAVEFSRSEQLNWVRRAQFANAFRWRLKDMGYPAAFVDVATEGLVYALSDSKR